MERHVARQEAVLELGRQAIVEPELAVLVQRALELVRDSVEVDYAALLELLADSRVVLHSTRGPEGAGPWPRGTEDTTLGQHVLATGVPLLVSDLRAETRFRPPRPLLELGVVSCLSVVVRGSDLPFGVLSAHHTVRRDFGAADLHLLESIANIIGAAIQRHRAQSDLRAAEERYRRLVEHLPLVTYVDSAGHPGTHLYVSPQVEELLGFPPEAFVADPALFSKRLHPDDREYALAELTRAEGDRRAISCEYRLVAADGRQLWVRDESVLIENDDGTAYTLGTLRDVTEHRRLEEQFHHAQRLEAVGRLAGGIAHDFNNLLTAMQGYTELALAQVGDDPPLRADIEEIAFAASRAAALTGQLLAFSRRQLLRPEVLELNEVVAAMKAMLSRLIGEQIELVTQLGAPGGYVQADRVQLEQVIVNLAVNARDAMTQGGGRLVLATREVEIGAGDNALAPGPYLLLTVTDTGEGFTADAREHAFEPFFTTKERGKGTGLGLATVYGIVKQSGGHVTVASEPGRGARFEIHLPRVAPPAPAAEEKAEPAPGRGSEHVLLVEDEDVVRRVLAQALERAGYDVAVAADGAEALELAAASERPIAALVTDVVMPGLSGRELAARLLGERPGLRVLYISGYARDVLGDEDLRSQAAGFLQKPFTMDELALALRELLDRPLSAAA